MGLMCSSSLSHISEPVSKGTGPAHRRALSFGHRPETPMLFPWKVIASNNRLAPTHTSEPVAEGAVPHTNRRPFSLPRPKFGQAASRHAKNNEIDNHKGAQHPTAEIR
jgi:hypothetical protein